MPTEAGWCVKCTLGEPCTDHPDRLCPPGCTNTVHAGSMCPTHYRHRRLNRDIREYGRVKCLNCEGKHYSRGLCRRHYRSR